jgi:hypothetical protein
MHLHAVPVIAQEKPQRRCEHVKCRSQACTHLQNCTLPGFCNRRYAKELGVVCAVAEWVFIVMEHLQ